MAASFFKVRLENEIDVDTRLVGIVAMLCLFLVCVLFTFRLDRVCFSFVAC